MSEDLPPETTSAEPATRRIVLPLAVEFTRQSVTPLPPDTSWTVLLLNVLFVMVAAMLTPLRLFPNVLFVMAMPVRRVCNCDWNSGTLLARTVLPSMVMFV